MEWSGPAIILSARPLGEGDAVVTIFSEQHGVVRGLARGAQSRARAVTWQTGNVIAARWVARLAEQLGSLGGELVLQPAAAILDDPLAIALLTAACATAEGALAEHDPHAGVFASLLHLLARLADPRPPVAAFVRWEVLLLAELGFGLDLAACAVTGTGDDLAFVSPRTGRAVSAAAAGIWRDRLLPLPPFLHDANGDAPGDPGAWRDGLRLTGHFLARDAFGQRHRPLPQARLALYERVATLAETQHGR